MDSCHVIEPANRPQQPQQPQPQIQSLDPIHRQLDGWLAPRLPATRKRARCRGVSFWLQLPQRRLLRQPRSSQVLCLRLCLACLLYLVSASILSHDLQELGDRHMRERQQQRRGRRQQRLSDVVARSDHWRGSGASGDCSCGLLQAKLGRHRGRCKRRCGPGQHHRSAITISLVKQKIAIPGSIPRLT